MSTEANKEIAVRYFDERWNKGNLDICDEVLDPDIDINGHNVDDFKAWTYFVRNALDNIRLTVIDLIAEDDRVVIQWEFCATYKGEFMNLPATGNVLSYKGVALLRFRNGKIIEAVAYRDQANVLTRIGIELP